MHGERRQLGLLDHGLGTPAFFLETLSLQPAAGATLSFPNGLRFGRLLIERWLR
jgi:hypothetical protein